VNGLTKWKKESGIQKLKAKERMTSTSGKRKGAISIVDLFNLTHLITSKHLR
jgi:hypothetical protein